jgi:hypothetical protein
VPVLPLVECLTAAWSANPGFIHVGATRALDRLLVAGWRILARDAAVAAAVTYLSSDAMRRSHQAMHHKVAGLLDRGRGDGSFRAGLPASWLVTSVFALIHACAGEVRVGRLSPDAAESALAATIRDLLSGRQPAKPGAEGRAARHSR